MQPRNLDAATTMRSADTELRNTIELRATASEIASPKPDLDAKAKKKDFEAIFKRNFKRKIASAKIEKICWQITVAALAEPLQYYLRDPAAKDKSITHAAVAPSNLDAAIPMRSATTGSRHAKNYAHRNNHSLQNAEEEPIKLGTTAAAPAAHRRYLSSPAAATLHGKIHGFVLRLPPQHKPRATFMQPLQCIVQHHVANLHLSTHMSTTDDNNHAAIPMRSATTGSRHAKNYAHRNNHSLQNTEEEPIKLGTTAAAPAAHRRYLSSPAAATLHGKIHGFVLRLPPQHKPRATFMQPLQYVSQHHVANLHLSTHMARPDDNNHTAITRVYCYVMSSLTQQSHTALHWGYWVWHHSLTPPFIECIAMWCLVSHHSLTPPFIECIVMWCQVSHHPSLSVFLCDVKSHTTLHWVYCYR